MLQIEMRATLEKKMSQKEKARKEESLKNLAKKAREEHAGIKTSAPAEGEKEREKLRQDRARSEIRNLLSKSCLTESLWTEKSQVKSWVT